MYQHDMLWLVWELAGAKWRMKISGHGTNYGARMGYPLGLGTGYRFGDGRSYGY